MPPMPPPRSARRAAHAARRAAWGVALTASLLLGGGLIAHAEPDGGIPSQAEVEAARAAADDAARRVAELDAAYARAPVDLDAVQQRAAAVGESANGARWELEQRTRAARETARRAKTARAAADRAEVVLQDYAALSYQQGGGLESLAPLLDADGPQELSDRMSALTFVGTLYAERLDDARLAVGTATALTAVADAARVAQQQASERAETAVARARAELQQAEADTTRVAGQREVLAAELARLRRTSVATERRRLDALAAQAQQAVEHAQPTADPSGTATSTPPPTTSTSTPPPTSTSTSTRPPSSTSTRTTPPPPTSTSTTSSTSTSTSTPRPPTTTSTSSSTSSSSTSTTGSTSSTSSTTSPPPPSGGAGAAIAYAQAQLGKPYEWGAAGPDSFDCSGLTMMAWRQAGVYLSHYTGAQWSETARVPIASLQPGDIVFFGYSGESSTHVGLYVGGGQMIEAPHTGAVVRYASIYRSDLLPYGGRPG